MKIAQISPLCESVPPKLYGGTERVVSCLTEELVRQGHDVTLFASGDSVTQAELVPVIPHALRLDPSVENHLYSHLVMLDQVMQSVHEFDLLHFHIDTIHFPLIRNIKDKTVTTLHGRLDLPDLVPFYKAFSDIPLVSISNSQRKPMPPVRWLGTIAHGLPRSLYKLNAKRGRYLAFLGRIAPEKSPDQAIAIALQAGIPLKIAAKVDPMDKDYFENKIRPLLDSPYVEFIGEINDKEKESFLGQAMALVFPINWPEPFGLTMIESMACGTPVIAYNRGSVPEVIKDGTSGFIVHDIEGAVEAIKRLPELDRTLIRHYFEEHFTVERMAENYVSLYTQILDTVPKAKRTA
ncbi:MAG: glycosyltransferase family 4 protein [Bdellovibrionales bacterium]